MFNPKGRELKTRAMGTQALPNEHKCTVVCVSECAHACVCVGGNLLINVRVQESSVMKCQIQKRETGQDTRTSA